VFQRTRTDRPPHATRSSLLEQQGVYILVLTFCIGRNHRGTSTVDPVARLLTTVERRYRIGSDACNRILPIANRALAHRGLVGWCKKSTKREHGKQAHLRRQRSL
jgi:hypothetical protein